MLIDSIAQAIQLRALRVFAIAICAIPFLASAQTYPAKTVKIVVGYAAGGAVDIVARTVGQSMASSMGQAVIVKTNPVPVPTSRCAP